MLTPPAADHLSFKHLKAKFHNNSDTFSTIVKHYRLNTVSIYCRSIALDCRCSCYCVHSLDVSLRESVNRFWMNAPSSVSFLGNLNWWCNEIVSAATLVSRTTLISAVSDFFLFLLLTRRSSTKSSQESMKKKARLFRVGYLINCERKRARN